VEIRGCLPNSCHHEIGIASTSCIELPWDDRQTRLGIREMQATYPSGSENELGAELRTEAQRRRRLVPSSKPGLNERDAEFRRVPDRDGQAGESCGMESEMRMMSLAISKQRSAKSSSFYIARRFRIKFETAIPTTSTREIPGGQMNIRLGHQATNTPRVRSLFVVILLLGYVLAAAAHAGAKRIAPPTTPSAITPPAGNSAFLLGRAEGTQGYVCLPTNTGASTASWTVNAPRPEATLFVNSHHRYVEVVTHFFSPNTNPNESASKPLPFGSPTWQSSRDNSKVWGKPLASIPAGSDNTSCPNTDSIACLLLQSVGSEAGRSGGRFLTQTTFIQRLNTKGGSAPDTGCSALSDVGKQELVPYSADYYFFRAHH
jgi:hypothetical protein